MRTSETPPVPEPASPALATALSARSMIRAVAVHLANEHAFLADLFAMPALSDQTVVCTNVRTPDGKRPVWAESKESIYYFPWTHIRFIEIPEGAFERADSTGSSRSAGNGAAAPPEAVPEPELEIDEDFLRRVRDV